MSPTRMVRCPPESIGQILAARFEAGLYSGPNRDKMNDTNTHHAQDKAMTTYNVIRCENRECGTEECIGTVTADTPEQARTEAAGQYECDTAHHLIVVDTDANEAWNV